MRARFFSMSFIAICLMTSISLSAQFDDLYYDYKKDETVKNEDVTLTETRYSDNDSDYYKGSDYDSDEYDNYDEYSYSDRIRRFHRPVQNYSSFDNWYSNYYYDPYYSNSGVNVFIGTGWGWNSWNRPWSYSYYNNPWGWNSWNSGWGYNSWNNPWGWNSWNSGWGWNSYGYCGNSGWGNNYYGNVYYGNGWNGSNWNNNTEYSNKVYGSRKGGSLSSSTKGRDASPRRIISGGSNDLNVDKANANIETSSRSQRTDRTFKGDIKSASGNNTDESVRRTDRSRIYSNPSNVKERSESESSSNTSRKQDRYSQQNNSTSPAPSRRSEERPSRRTESRSTYDNGSSNDSWNSGSSRSSSSGSNMGSSRSSGSSSSHSGGGSSRSGGSRRGG